MRRAQAAIVALTAGALALTACSAGAKQGAGDDQSRKDAEKMRGQIAFADAAASKGPAAPVPGATPGGTIKVYQRVSAIDPKNAEAPFLLARLYEQRGMTEEARAEYQRAKELHTVRPGLHGGVHSPL